MTASLEQGSKAKYKVTSTVFLSLNATEENSGKIDMAGNTMKVKEQILPYDPKEDI